MTAPPLRLGDPALAHRDGFVVVLPGGGYRLRAEHEGIQVAQWLASEGIRAGVLDYTVDPSPASIVLGEVLGAVADVRAGRYGAVMGPVALLGFSAGGHLAGLAATATTAELGPDRARPDLVLLGYPVVSMVRSPHQGSRKSLLSGAPGRERATLARALSVEQRVDDTTPPVFVWHTADDEVVPASHTVALAAALINARCEVEAHVYPRGEHGLGLAALPDGRSWRPTALQWLRSHGIGR
ncbi:acetylesterase [Luteimicrobium album]|uniref:Acetylesterase n=1 Tax=Luteimicrobium album TaxID=1054550 RepID=A0ABQ6I1F0_9MICO|nr:alpha/beta hydrolase [Luteimicrobium album]GMA23988.1 acetylesterase [Luteimicrobium album]